MEKRPYYVNVETGEIHTDNTVAAFQFEIEATEIEAGELAKKFAACDQAARDTFWRSHVPFVPYHNDSDNHRYDAALIEIYQFLHDHGQSLTREHIESMGILKES